jgi:hypothetical protein
MPKHRVRSPIQLDVPRFEQHDDLTCGPTCLAKVYQYYGFARPLNDIIGEIPRNPDGGTLAVNLGIGAMHHGFRPTIYPFGLRVFDPTWRRLPRTDLIERLQARMQTVDNVKLQRAVSAYVDYLLMGGKVRFRDPSPTLLIDILRRGDPILTGLSATFLYGTSRELGDRYDDVAGHSSGHFVVVCGYRPRSDRFVVTDPFRNVPLSRTGRYTVGADRLLAAILLGDQTFDAVLLTLGKRSERSG